MKNVLDIAVDTSRTVQEIRMHAIGILCLIDQMGLSMRQVRYLLVCLD